MLATKPDCLRARTPGHVRPQAYSLYKMVAGQVLVRVLLAVATVRLLGRMVRLLMNTSRPVVRVVCLA